MAKTKALISFAVTAKLICVFVFAYAKSGFSHNEAQLPTARSFPVIEELIDDPSIPIAVTGDMIPSRSPVATIFREVFPLLSPLSGGSLLISSDKV